MTYLSRLGSKNKRGSQSESIVLFGFIAVADHCSNIASKSSPFLVSRSKFRIMNTGNSSVQLTVREDIRMILVSIVDR
jgi:hypothetical protein